MFTGTPVIQKLMQGYGGLSINERNFLDGPKLILIELWCWCCAVDMELKPTTRVFETLSIHDVNVPLKSRSTCHVVRSWNI